MLDAALRQIAEEGVAELSLREVARIAGVSHAAPYRHFPSKSDLLAAVAEEGFRMLAASMTTESAPATSPLERFSRVGMGYVLFAVEHPTHFRVMFSAVGRGAQDSPSLAEAGQTAFNMLLTSIAAAQAAGQMKRGDPRELAVSCWSMVHGLASLLVDRCFGPAPFTADPRALAALVTRDLVAGMHA